MIKFWSWLLINYIRTLSLACKCWVLICDGWNNKYFSSSFYFNLWSMDSLSRSCLLNWILFRFSLDLHTTHTSFLLVLILDSCENLLDLFDENHEGFLKNVKLSRSVNNFQTKFSRNYIVCFEVWERGILDILLAKEITKLESSVLKLINRFYPCPKVKKSFSWLNNVTLFKIL